jgi:hypothetical protein
MACALHPEVVIFPDRQRSIEPHAVPQQRATEQRRRHSEAWMLE